MQRALQILSMILYRKLNRKFIHALLRMHQGVRLLLWKYLKTAQIKGKPILKQPTALAGDGIIDFGKNVRIGFYPSPHFLTGSCHIEARAVGAVVRIGDMTTVNNNFVAIAEMTRIDIGDRCLIGPNVNIFDSDFHGLSPAERRYDGNTRRAPPYKCRSKTHRTNNNKHSTNSRRTSHNTDCAYVYVSTHINTHLIVSFFQTGLHTPSHAHMHTCTYAHTCAVRSA